MNYSKAFSYVFEDKDWVSKVLIAGLISLIPVIGWLYIAGWMIEIVRRVKAGRTDILPQTHFSDFLSLGFKAWVVSLVYMIPIFLLSGVTSILNGWNSGTSSDAASVMLTGMSCVVSLISIILSLYLSMLLIYAYIRLAETDKMSECFKFGDVFRIVNNNLKLFLLLMLMDIVCSIIACVGYVFCFVGGIFTLPYSMAILGHLMGQAWSNLKDAPTPIRHAAPNTTSADIVEAAPKAYHAEASQPVETAAPTVIEASAPAETPAEPAAEDQHKDSDSSSNDEPLPPAE